MASKRKGTPVRRLDLICSKLHQAGQPTTVSDSASEITGQTSVERESAAERGYYNNDVQKEDMSKSLGSTSAPPEGVYILQPRSVSDDESTPESNAENGRNPKSIEVRKRSREEDEGMDTIDKRSERDSYSGLDLSVKMPRIDHVSDRGDCAELDISNLTPFVQSTSFSNFAENAETRSDHVREQMEKYHHLMKLVAQQMPLAQALEEVGLSVHEFFAIHRLNTQVVTSAKLEKQEHTSLGDVKVTSATPVLSVDFERLSSKEHHLSTEMPGNDKWASGKTEHDAKIQNLLKEAKEDVIQQQKQGNEAQQLNSSRLQQHPTTLNPAMAAALMASLSSNPDQSNEERKAAIRGILGNTPRSIFGENSPSPKTMDYSFTSPMNSAAMLDRSTSSKNYSITAGTVSSGVGSIKRGTLDPSNFDEDVFDQYITKFTNMNRCGLLTCQYYTRDHYHCVVEDCNYQRFTNKADVIRHYNMHKKRDNSLAHGFLRFSPTEDCSSKYPDCHLNGKSTHYHCMQPDCNKVYTSTSDVMTHENFHKKYLQFVCSGFKRFRATVECDLETCSFRHQKTTHFHCTRSDCNFTFKNKCDIEKHKAYHLRDDEFISKGFKKFYKNETCGSSDCVWNYTANHFHCLRSGCNFSFTSTSQMESHKRKHDRNEHITDNKDNSHIVNTLNSPKLPIFNPALFQEAAKKFLASVPAAYLPHVIGASTQSPQHMVNREPSHYVSTNSSRSEPISPSTPLNMKNYVNYELNPNPEIFKADQQWKVSAYGDGADKQTPTALPRDGGSPISLQRSDLSPEDWPRSSGFISQRMAICAAAALKSSTNKPEVQTAQGQTSGNRLDSGKNDTKAISESTSHDSNKDAHPNAGVISKYFVSTNAYKCWNADCDFYAKHHFHCLVEGCEAMFATEANVLKHAKFHENLESMGAALRIQNRPLATVQRPSGPKSSDPPPGYIALQSRMSKPTLLGCSDPQHTIDNPVVSTGNRENAEIANDPLPAETSIAPYITNAYSQSPLTTLASQIYANALFKNPVTDPNNSRLCSAPASTFGLLQNPASFSAFMARMATTAPCLTEHPAIAHASKNNEAGFIHIKTGMQCLRSDCKYACQNHWHCTINRCRYVCKSLGKAQTHRQAHDSLDAYAKSAKESFRSYSVKKQCPNPNCEYRLRGHYHCLKPGCSFATIGTSKLPWHMKKHEKIARREASGFKYYTKKEQCNQQDCKYNGLFSHYHCVRKGCCFAFQYKHQMSTHVRKHLKRMLGRTSARGEDIQDIDHANVDSGDDSLPLIIDEMEEAEQRPGSSIIEDAKEQLSQQQLAVLDRMTKQMKPRSYEQHSQNSVSDTSRHESSTSRSFETARMAELPDNSDSNSDDNSNGKCGALDLSALAAASLKSDESGGQQQTQDWESMNEDSMSNGMGQFAEESDARMTESDAGVPPNTTSPMLKTTPGLTQSQFYKFKLTETVIDGFTKFEANENCGDEKCSYTFKVSHYHCTRENCSYRFTGRSHMFKHQQHHDRVAGLVRDDFKRYKATHLCENEHCDFRGKNTHFHCLRCNFKCTDSAKVGTHRRQHMKADALKQSGFQRVRGKDDCGREDCKYRFRNMSHFHCLQPGCSYTIVGLTGIELHAEKHKRGVLQPTPSKLADNTDLIMKNLAAFRSMQQQILSASLVRNGSDDGSVAHDLSVHTLAAFHNLQNRSLSVPARTPTPPGGQCGDGRSNPSSPFLAVPAQGEPDTHLVPNFAFLSSTPPVTPMAAASSPVSSTSRNIVSEGVGVGSY